MCESFPRERGLWSFVVTGRCVAICIALGTLALAPTWHTTSAQGTTRRYTATDIVQLMRGGVKEPRVLTLLADGCVVRGADASTQETLRAGGASARVQRLASSLACPDSPPSTPTSAPPLSAQPPAAPPPAAPPASSAAAAARFGLGDDQFVLVQPGSFEMGSSNEADEKPVHRVTLSRAFSLQRTEVTQAQWQAVMGSNPSRFTQCGATCPVEQVSWDDVQQFITRLNQATPGVTYRLPTEAEWEYAARAGTTGDYGGTGVLDEMGWYDQNAGGTTHPVGQKQANAFGLFDMHGNVWEWVQDWYSRLYYEASPLHDPQGPSRGSTRVLRGGSWEAGALDTRSAYRGLFTPSLQRVDIGFRLARTP